MLIPLSSYRMAKTGNTGNCNHKQVSTCTYTTKFRDWNNQQIGSKRIMGVEFCFQFYWFCSEVKKLIAFCRHSEYEKGAILITFPYFHPILIKNCKLADSNNFLCHSLPPPWGIILADGSPGARLAGNFTLNTRFPSLLVVRVGLLNCTRPADGLRGRNTGNVVMPGITVPAGTVEVVTPLDFPGEFWNIPKQRD